MDRHRQHIAPEELACVTGGAPRGQPSYVPDFDSMIKQARNWDCTVADKDSNGVRYEATPDGVVKGVVPGQPATYQPKAR